MEISGFQKEMHVRKTKQNKREKGKLQREQPTNQKEKNHAIIIFSLKK